MRRRLWLTSPAGEYMEGFPIGNGRIAAMVLGGKTERIALNHEWLWRGQNRDRNCEENAAHLSEVREFLLAGKFEQGTAQANRYFGGNGGISGVKNRVDPYQPAGDLFFEPDHRGAIENYTRELDLQTATATVRYTCAGRAYARECFCMAQGGGLVLRLTGERLGGRLYLSRVDDPECTLTRGTGGTSVYLEGRFTCSIQFVIRMSVVTDGEAVVDRDGILLKDCGEAIVYLDVGCSVKTGNAWDELTFMPDMGFDRLYQGHRDAFSRLYGAFSLDIPVAEPDLPLDRRIRALREGEEDAHLPWLYFHFGRYLLLTGGMGDLPLNLQGKWNEDLHPPWESDYHLDINLQMCYWIAEPTGLGQCADRLSDWILRFLPSAREAAKRLYGCRGVWYPIQTDLWGRSTPESYGWGVWIGAAAWLAQHIWNHYRYHPDEEYLKAVAYPFHREVAAFYEDYLIEDESGLLQAVPSQSPENRFEGTGNWPVSIGISSAMDIQLILESLTHAIAGAKLLHCDGDLIKKWQGMLDRLPKMKIGEKGQLLEWDREIKEVEPGHRHLSHLYGLYPGELFDQHDENTLPLVKACEKSLELRLSSGGGPSGWSRSWVACLFARLGRGEDAWRHFHALIGDFATVSLLDLHPPRIFQIDGNLGGAAAVIEMIFQNPFGEFRFLPALPSVWPEGGVRGLRAKGGFTVDFIWKDKRPQSALIRSGSGAQLVIRENFPIASVAVNGAPAKPIREAGLCRIDTNRGDEIVVSFGG